ncbi:MAG: hypothetical protein R2778_06140 [Saprospiraceae bacterium]
MLALFKIAGSYVKPAQIIQAGGVFKAFLSIFNGTYVSGFNKQWSCFCLFSHVPIQISQPLGSLGIIRTILSPGADPEIQIFLTNGNAGGYISCVVI